MTSQPEHSRQVSVDLYHYNWKLNRLSYLVSPSVSGHQEKSCTSYIIHMGSIKVKPHTINRWLYPVMKPHITPIQRPLIMLLYILYTLYSKLKIHLRFPVKNGTRASPRLTPTCMIKCMRWWKKMVHDFIWHSSLLLVRISFEVCICGNSRRRFRWIL